MVAKLLTNENANKSGYLLAKIHMVAKHNN